MPWLLILIWAFASPQAIDVSSIAVKPSTVVDLDLGQLKGDLRQIAWSPDASQLYVQTVEGNPPREKLHHYVVPSEGGPLVAADKAPGWAAEYWAFKSDRTAPGVRSLEIDVTQSREKTKIGVGSGRPGSMASNLGSDATENASMANEGQREVTWTFSLLGETVSEFKGMVPIPGLMFSWGPRGSGAIAFTDAAGHVMLMDQQKHKHAIADAKDATLPAWSMDGERLAYAVKDGRKKYKLVWCTIAK